MSWPIHPSGPSTCLVAAQVVLSTKPGATIGGNTLPVSYSKFTSMVKQGDTIFLGRYLVTGSEESSCYLTVCSSSSPPSPSHSWRRHCRVLGGL